MRLARMFFLAALAVTAGACGSSSSSTTSPSTTPSTPSPTPSGPSVTASIPRGADTLTTTAFGANPLTVSSGTTVVWTNNDSIAHTSTSNNGQWNSGTINPGQSFRFTFSTPGTYAYRCTIHPNMVGTVTVQ